LTLTILDIDSQY